MKKTLIKFCTAALLFCCAFSLSAQEVLKPKIVEKLQQNVFEVVVEKIQEDPLSYEKELPLDRIPYQIRMDKYDSIGTAFLLTDGHFYTAAHVLSLQHLTQLDKYYIRSTDGKTYKIGNVVKFASDRDFVVFDAIDFDNTQAKGLEIDSKYKLNSSVFAVGNAQGEGIVMRNGLLTSVTPEQRNGAWNWIRFSAAASPGNSGGPLVTPQGKVIGIVAMKNSSENLNYALPINEVKSIANNKGEIHSEAYYVLPNIVAERFYHTFDFEMELPKSIEEVRKSCYEACEKNTSELVNKIAADFLFTGKKNFVQADPFSDILNVKFAPDFPNLLCLNDKGKWGCYSPQKPSSLKLDNNGSIQAGSMLGLYMSYIKKPDNISVQEYIENPKLIIDTLAKIFVNTRAVGSEKITITSYGEPVHTSTHTDNLGRTWLISAYNIPFADYVCYNYALPLPDGIFSLTSIRSTDIIWNGIVYDFAFLSDFVVTGYTGTAKDWSEYLAIPENVYPRHKVLKNALLSMTDKKTVIDFETLKLDCPSDIYKVNDKTDIECGIGYVPDQEKGLKLEIQQLGADTLQNTNDNATVILMLLHEPNENCHKSIIDDYQKIKSKTIPFDGKPFEQEQKTSIFVPHIYDNYIKLFGLVCKGSKLDVIEKNAKVLQEVIK